MCAAPNSFPDSWAPCPANAAFFISRSSITLITRQVAKRKPPRATRLERWLRVNRITVRLVTRRSPSLQRRLRSGRVSPRMPSRSTSALFV